MRLPRSSLFFLLAALLLSPASAQSDGQRLNPHLLLTDVQQLVEVINTAEEEILMNAVTIQQRPVAEALRGAMVERGVEVYVLTTPSGANARASFLHSLFLAGAKVRVSSVTEPFAIIDRTRALVGPLLVEPVATVTAQEDEGTFLISDAQQVSRFSRTFVEAYGQATRFSYVPSSN